MTKVNLYLESKKRLLKSFEFSETITNIDSARLLLLKKLNSFYLNSKYKIQVNLDNDQNSCQIDVFFEKNTELNREFLLKEILQ